MNIFSEIMSNYLLLGSVVAVVFFLIISIILMKKASKKSDDQNRVEIEKIDGATSVFDEILEESQKENNNQLDLDSMIAKMQKDLDAKASEVIEKFENEQEEKAVISYQELIQSKKENDMSLNHDEKNIEESEPADLLMETEHIEPVSEEGIEQSDIKSILSKLNIVENDVAAVSNVSEVESVPSIEEPVNLPSKLNMKDEFVEAIKTGNYEEINSSEHENIENIEKESEPNKFKATEFISPIYGVQDIKIQYPTVQNMRDFKDNYNKYNKFEVDNTVSPKKVDKDDHKDEDFLNSLKEFRKNLE